MYCAAGCELKQMTPNLSVTDEWMLEIKLIAPILGIYFHQLWSQSHM